MMKKKSVRVYAPASISNLGSGFDVLGLAIDKPGDIVVARRIPGRELKFSVRSGGTDLPSGTSENVAGYVASLMVKEFNPPFGIELALEKKMPVGSGLGSSAASSVAAAVAVNALLPKPLHKIDLLRFALEGEKKASGAGHADNAAPSLLGGVCLIRSYHPLDVVSIPVRNSIVWVVVHPHLSIRTEEARRILPLAISLESAIQQWGNTSGLTAGLITGDVRLVGKCVDDVIIEPIRAKLIPGFHGVKKAAIDAGAAGCSISGSGPSMFAVAGTIASAKNIASAMVKAFRLSGNTGCDIFISKVNMHGARVVRAT